jgi:hypothetical protein
MSRRRGVLSVAIGAWALLVLAGAMAVVRRAARLEENRWYVAAHKMPRNHRVAADDVAYPPLALPSASLHLPDRATVVGQYLRSKVEKGKPLKPELLRRVPRVLITPGKVAAFVPLASPVSALIGVGALIDVIGQSTIAQDVEVEAVWCESTTCWAVVELTPGQAAVMNQEETPHAVPAAAKAP